MAADALPALIVGAGPTGLTAAVEFARYGVPIRIVDELPGPSELSKALAVQARTLEYFERVGLLEQLIAAGIQLQGVTIYSERKVIAKLDVPRGEHGPRVLAVPQPATEGVLAGEFVRRGGTIERSVELTSFADDGDAIVAHLKHADGRDEAVRTRWLVGCDGPHSLVRHALDVSFSGLAYDESFALADTKLEGEVPTRERGAVFLEHGDLAVLFPLPGDRWRIIVEVHQAPWGDAEPTVEQIADVVARMSGLSLRFYDVAWSTKFVINQRKAGHYVKGRALLAGDAAHIHSPIGGQGMNYGIADAVNLAWKVALVERGFAPPELVQSYEAEREPAGKALLRATGLAGDFILSQNPIVEAVRDRVVGLVASLGFVQERLREVVGETLIGYRGSPIVDGRGWRGPVQAGDRNPVLRDTVQDLRHVALAFVDRTDPASQARADALAVWARQSYPDLLTVTTPDWALAPHYGFGDEGVAIVRPDDYLGYVDGTIDIAGPRAYFAKLFGRS
jgi:2-polyprenyl-6-methoxyphenol hydroxylase-like FAD-dependent oxidoreductase